MDSERQVGRQFLQQADLFGIKSIGFRSVDAQRTDYLILGTDGQRQIRVVTMLRGPLAPRFKIRIGSGLAARRGALFSNAGSSGSAALWLIAPGDSMRVQVSLSPAAACGRSAHRFLFVLLLDADPGHDVAARMGDDLTSVGKQARFVLRLNHCAAAG